MTPLKKYRQISREEKPLSQGRSPAQCTWNLGLPARGTGSTGAGKLLPVCIDGFFILGCTLDVRFAPPRPFSVELMGKLRPGRWPHRVMGRGTVLLTCPRASPTPYGRGGGAGGGTPHLLLGPAHGGGASCVGLGGAGPGARWHGRHRAPAA